MKDPVFLDNASTTGLCPEAREAMLGAADRYFGNPSSLHRQGTDALDIISKARSQIADLLSCSEDEIFFTSGATESINTVLKGFRDSYPKTSRLLVTSAAEHNATLETCRYLEKQGVRVIYLASEKNGAINDENLIKALEERPGLVSLVHVNNETGAVTDLKKISSLIRRISPRTKFHVDAAQSLGKIDFGDLIKDIDYISASAHKIHGPKGAGLLYVGRNRIMVPLIHGGGQEKGLRSGTENTPSIAGFGAAASEAAALLKGEGYSDISRLKTVFLETLAEWSGRYQINSPPDGSPYILNISFPGSKPEVLLRALGAEGVFVSAASACSSKKTKVSHVLRSMGFDDKRAGSAIRISFSRYNTQKESVQAAREFIKALEGFFNE